MRNWRHVVEWENNLPRCKKHFYWSVTQRFRYQHHVFLHYIISFSSTKSHPYVLWHFADFNLFYCQYHWLLLVTIEPSELYCFTSEWWYKEVKAQSIHITTTNVAKRQQKSHLFMKKILMSARHRNLLFKNERNISRNVNLQSIQPHTF